jgi:hypothetical protein
MIASGPGVGKSALALLLAIRSETKGIYMSADSDPATQYSRTVSMLTGMAVSEVQAQMERNEVTAFNEVLAEVGHLRFDFDAGPTLSDIEEVVYCYGLIHGRWPEILVLDNLSNAVDESGGDGFVALENILTFLHEIARKTNACTIVLHHLVGEWENGDKPAPLSGLRGKVSKLPELIITLYRKIDDEGFEPEQLGIAVVKNRNGKASAAGRMVLHLAMDLETMAIEDIEVNNNVWEEAA